LEGSAYFIQRTAGSLRLNGEDRVAFLQRQTTNDLSQLALDRSVLTVLVSPAARILDVLRVYSAGVELIVLTLPGHREDTARYLKKRIFFNDKVQLEDESDGYIQADLEGPKAGEALVALGYPTVPEIDGVAFADLDGSRWAANGQRGLSGVGIRLLIPAENWGEVEAKLDAAGVKQLSEESLHVLRVEAGLPAAGAELTEEFTPFEAGLGEAVSGNKGCFTGQEVLARQVTYDKVTRHLVRLRLEAEAQAGARLFANGGLVGIITSAAVSPRFGPIALGMVKRPHHEPESELTAGENETKAIVIRD
jgi:folate-binding protein YgfZ